MVVINKKDGQCGALSWISSGSTDPIHMGLVPHNMGRVVKNSIIEQFNGGNHILWLLRSACNAQVKCAHFHQTNFFHLSNIVNDSIQLTTIIISKIPLVPMGVLAPGSAHARPSAQPPINTSGNFWRTCLGGGYKIVRKSAANEEACLEVISQSGTSVHNHNI
jgi:hypothetical protein